RGDPGGVFEWGGGGYAFGTAFRRGPGSPWTPDGENSPPIAFAFQTFVECSDPNSCTAFELFPPLPSEGPFIPIDLGTLGGRGSFAVAVNASGEVVGASNTGVGAPSHTFLWTPAGGMIDLGVPPGAVSSQPWAINARGQVVGFGSGPGFRPFSWTREGGMIDLGSLGGSIGQALAVNDLGQVVGWSVNTAFTAAHPFS